MSGGHDDRLAKGAKWGRVWGGVSHPQPTRRSGERRELLQWVRGGAPVAIAFSACFRPQNASGTGSKKNDSLTVVALCVKLQYC